MKFVSRSQTWLLASLLLADIAVFSGSNPHNAPSMMLMIGFGLLIVNFYLLMLGLVRLSNYGLLTGRYRHKRFARLATGLFAGLVALQSIGELGSRDIVVLLPLAVLGYLYISYGRGGKNVAQSSARQPLA